MIQVGGTSQTKAVAGKIAHEARLGQPPALLAKGPASLNQAIKVDQPGIREAFRVLGWRHRCGTAAVRPRA